MKKTSPVSRSGRFAADPGDDVARFTESVSFDWRLWQEDILGSIVHATMLRKIGVLTRSELNRGASKKQFPISISAPFQSQPTDKTVADWPESIRTPPPVRWRI